MVHEVTLLILVSLGITFASSSQSGLQLEYNASQIASSNLILNDPVHGYHEIRQFIPGTGKPVSIASKYGRHLLEIEPDNLVLTSYGPVTSKKYVFQISNKRSILKYISVFKTENYHKSSQLVENVSLDDRCENIKPLNLDASNILAAASLSPTCEKYPGLIWMQKAIAPLTTKSQAKSALQMCLLKYGADKTANELTFLSKSGLENIVCSQSNNESSLDPRTSKIELAGSCLNNTSTGTTTLLHELLHRHEPKYRIPPPSATRSGSGERPICLTTKNSLAIEEEMDTIIAACLGRDIRALNKLDKMKSNIELSSNELMKLTGGSLSLKNLSLVEREEVLRYTLAEYGKNPRKSIAEIAKNAYSSCFLQGNITTEVQTIKSNSDQHDRLMQELSSSISPNPSNPDFTNASILFATSEAIEPISSEVQNLVMNLSDTVGGLIKGLRDDNSEPGIYYPPTNQDVVIEHNIEDKTSSATAGSQSAWNLRVRLIAGSPALADSNPSPTAVLTTRDSSTTSTLTRSARSALKNQTSSFATTAANSSQTNGSASIEDVYAKSSAINPTSQSPEAVLANIREEIAKNKSIDKRLLISVLKKRETMLRETNIQIFVDESNTIGSSLRSSKKYLLSNGQLIPLQTK